MLVLKRVDDARRDGDQILAVIAGSAVNHDGRSNGLIAPNPDAQADVLRRAYKDAGINPRTVDYIEAHGTGTVLGDPIEAQALGRVIGRGRPADKPALLGAIKTNVGHMESAAGAASLAKMVLSLQHDKLPPSINYAGPNPYIDFDAAHLRVLDTVADWPRYGGYAVAGVSSFGFGGANAHVVLREVLPRDVVEREPEPWSENPPAAAPRSSTSSTSAGCVSTSTANSSKTTTTRRSSTSGTDDTRLPGVTDEALRLKEIALEELAGRRASGAVDSAAGVGVFDVPQEGRRCRTGRLDGKPLRAKRLRWNRSAGRCRGATTAVPVRSCWPTTTTRPSRVCARSPTASRSRTCSASTGR